MAVEALSVSVLNRYIKSILDGDKNLQMIYVKGQISNFKKNIQSGHCYFTLKDENSQIKAVMFRFNAQKLRFVPENDMNVIVRGKISVYDVNGEYQIYIDDMQPDGIGALAVAFEQLKKKLAAEGLFDPAHKKHLPEYPEKIGVITSENGAAIRDIIYIINEFYPSVEVVLCPVSVQGSNSAEQIADAIRLFNERSAADVLIVARGGGSIEDLWSFNEETVARAVYESEIPIVSGVGHETDTTIIDYVADLRTATPTAAAKAAVPDRNKIIELIYQYNRQCSNYILGRINYEINRINSCNAVIRNNNPTDYIQNLIFRCDSARDSIDRIVNAFLNDKKNELSVAMAKLDASSPLKILSKGYSIVSKDGITISDSSQLAPGDIINIHLKNGFAECEVL